MRRWLALGVAVELAAALCFVVAYSRRELDTRFAAYAPLDELPSALGSFDPLDPLLWLGAAIALAVVGLVILALAWRGPTRG